VFDVDDAASHSVPLPELRSVADAKSIKQRRPLRSASRHRPPRSRARQTHAANDWSLSAHVHDTLMAPG